MVQKIHPRGVIWVPSSRLIWADHQKKIWQQFRPYIKKFMSKWPSINYVFSKLTIFDPLPFWFLTRWYPKLRFIVSGDLQNWKQDLFIIYISHEKHHKIWLRWSNWMSKHSLLKQHQKRIHLQMSHQIWFLVPKKIHFQRL